MKTKDKLAAQKKAAREIAEIMLAVLQQFPEEEQEARIRAVERIPIRHRASRKPSKRVPTQGSLPARRLRAKR
jgi:hypothetical protein